jgi:hypothetical protein
MRARILTLFACAISLVAFQEQPIVEWVRSHAVALKTPEAGHGFDDMQPLKKIVGQSRIVALGEATHGTREFFQLKHRMVEFLASQMGFTIFSIEANMPEAYRLNDYVLVGKGDPKTLIKGMYFWTWDTEEVLAMIEWMREFNQSGKGRIEFTGFDMQTPAVALQIVKDFCAKYDPEYSPALKEAGGQALKTSPHVPSFGVATATFPVREADGKRIRFSGYIKTDRVTDGYAGLWWRVDGELGKMLAFDNMQNRGATGTVDWKRYQIGLPASVNARNINFGVLQTGKGTAWFDSLAIQTDDAAYSGASLDLDFESTPPKGFSTGGQGYRVRPDIEIFHSGKQSLRIERLLDSPSTVAPEIAMATWKTVLLHLESSRAAYIAGKAAAPDVEWAIQNARIVLQGLQSRTNEVTRDESMAQNVRWIADRNPAGEDYFVGPQRARGGGWHHGNDFHGLIFAQDLWARDGSFRIRV